MAANKTVVVIDGQGGGIGRAIVERIRKDEVSGIELLVVGTNALATANMLKGGADAAATGESAIIWNCRHADIIMGAIGIVEAGSMYGELSPAMATAVSHSDACKILIPVGKCRLLIAGVSEGALPGRIDEAVMLLKQTLAE